MDWVSRLVALLLVLQPAAPSAAGQESMSPVAIENARPGTAGWELSKPATNREIEGYASSTSVAPGQSLGLHVSTPSRYFDIEIFRLGWYDGLGGRRVALARRLPGGRRATPDPRAGDGFIDCQWPLSYELPIGPNWVSGVYLARLTAREGGRQSFIPFVVRERETRDRAARDRAAKGRAPLLFQCSVTTWQAYNNWGGKSLYDFNSSGGKRALRVSFNRPYAAGPRAWAGVGAGELLTVPHAPRPGGWEYPMLRWLERSGYDVAYATNIDVHTDSTLLRGRRALLIVGHDEYWSRIMRDRIEAARDRGTHIGIFAANVGHWQIRLESSPAGGANRVMFCAKDHTLDPVFDTADDADLTVHFRHLHPRRPEVSLVGMMIAAEDAETDFVPVPERRDHWVFRGSGIAVGTTRAIGGLGGYEVDRTFADDSLFGRWSPPGLTVLARAPATGANGLPTVTETTVYKARSGAIVFSTGTMQWSWGLDDWGASALHPRRRHADVERITRNVLEAFSRGSE